MSRPNVPSRAWPRVAILALIGLIAAGCSDSARFTSGPYAANNRVPPADVTGSISAPPAPSYQVATQPLPAPSRPATVAARSGYANGAQGLGAYRPSERSGGIPGSVTAHRAPSQPAGHWTWDGGSAVTVVRGETVAMIARKYGVPVSAIMQVNHISNPVAIQPGQRLVIPRYVSTSAREARHEAPREALRVAAAPQPRAGGDVHIVAPGETLIAIARRHHMSLSALAHYNNIDPFTKLNVGDRVRVPAGNRRVAENRVPAPVPVPAPHLTRPRTVEPKHVASEPTQHVRLAKAEVHEQDNKNVTKMAEPAGGIPTFRWPVRGRIIASFGQRPNGAQNDGINLAVPEGTPIKAADDGVVAYAGNELKGYGNLVLIRHSDGYVSAYANASALLVKRGEAVKRGQVIARAGQTGNVTSPQLHFEIRKGSLPVDPMKYLNGA